MTVLTENLHWDQSAFFSDQIQKVIAQSQHVPFPSKANQRIKFKNLMSNNEVTPYDFFQTLVLI